MNLEPAFNANMQIVHLINSLKSKGGAETLVKFYSKTQPAVVWTLWDFEEKSIILNPIQFIKAIRKAEVVHVHLFPSLYLGALVSIVSEAKFIFTEHNTWNRRRNYRFFRWLEKFLYKRYSRVLCISKAVKTNLDAWLSFSSKTEVVENGVDLQHKFYTWKSKKPVGRSILMTGRFVEQKNQDLLIRFISQRPDWSLILVGGGPRELTLKNLAKRMLCDNRLYFVQPTRHPIPLPHKPDIYIQSSHWEGFGLTVVEAISSGIPAVVSNVEGVSQLIPTLASFDAEVSSLEASINFAFSDPMYYPKQLRQISRYSLDLHLLQLEKVYFDNKIQKEGSNKFPQSS